MEFNQRELNYLLTCLNYHYSESDFKNKHIMELNAELCKKFSYDLNKIEKAQSKQPDMEW